MSSPYQHCCTWCDSSLTPPCRVNLMALRNNRNTPQVYLNASRLFTGNKGSLTLRLSNRFMRNSGRNIARYTQPAYMHAKTFLWWGQHASVDINGSSNNGSTPNHIISNDHTDTKKCLDLWKKVSKCTWQICFSLPRDLMTTTPTMPAQQHRLPLRYATKLNHRQKRQKRIFKCALGVTLVRLMNNNNKIAHSWNLHWKANPWTPKPLKRWSVRLCDNADGHSQLNDFSQT